MWFMFTLVQMRIMTIMRNLCCWVDKNFALIIRFHFSGTFVVNLVIISEASFNPYDMATWFLQLCPYRYKLSADFPLPFLSSILFSLSYLYVISYDRYAWLSLFICLLHISICLILNKGRVVRRYTFVVTITVTKKHLHVLS